MIVDANVLTSAFIGRSFPLLADLRERGFALVIPMHQYAETKVIVGRKLSWPSADIDDIAQSVVTVLAIELYASREEDARQRLEARGQPDWPVLAAAFVLGDEIWSNDRDFFGTGVAVWKTINVRYAVPND